MAAQLCHSVAMADKAYAFRHRLEVSSKAVHIVDKSVSAIAEKKKSKRLAVEWQDEEG